MHSIAELLVSENLSAADQFRNLPRVLRRASYVATWYAKARALSELERRAYIDSGRKEVHRPILLAATGRTCPPIVPEAVSKIPL